MFYDTPNDKGVTFRKLADAMGAEIPEPAEIPEQAERLLWLFYRLSRRRPAGWDGPRPIPYEAIGALCRITGSTLSQCALSVLETLDDAWIDELNKVRQAFKDRESA